MTLNNAGRTLCVYSGKRNDNTNPTNPDPNTPDPNTPDPNTPQLNQPTPIEGFDGYCKLFTVNGTSIRLQAPLSEPTPFTDQEYERFASGLSIRGMNNVPLQVTITKVADTFGNNVANLDFSASDPQYYTTIGVCSHYNITSTL